jgi:CHASE3 domain sensor protein
MLVIMTSRDDGVTSEIDGAQDAAASRLGILLLCGGALTLLLAGLLLWWREGDRLFTDGLIAAIVACF